MIPREKTIQICRVQAGGTAERADVVVVEEPLEIRLVFGDPQNRKSRTLAVTMRTPGNDFELACGFLVSEGIVSGPDDVLDGRRHLPAPDGVEQSNSVEIELKPDVKFELSKLQRHFYTTSSCGICGKASLDAIKADNVCRLTSNNVIPAAVVHRLPDLLREQQSVFERTGGLHAAGLASLDGELLAIGEDVGRHNAVDKLIGRELLANRFPLRDRVLVLSGRASFELMQKALLAAISIVVAVGAPSSLAVELAEEFNLTLIGFTSKDRFNIYTGKHRVNV